MTSEEGVFAAGDTILGASLVVSAIDAGREAAHAIDTYLMGHSLLPKFGTR
jgi:glutamate synthase (NADPH/NADH) small chain